MIALLVSASMIASTPAYRVLDTIRVGGDNNGAWDYATFDPDTRKLYVAHQTTVAAIDVDTRAANPALVTAANTHIALPYDHGRMLLVTNGKANNVVLADAVTGAITATLETGANPDGAIIDPVTNSGFVMANAGHQVDVIDLASRTVAAHIPVAGKPEAGAIDGAGHVYTHLEDKKALLIIDAKRRTVIKSIEMKDCEAPSGLAYITGKDWILSACDNRTARVTDLKSGKAVARFPIGDDPDFALYDSDRQAGYIPTGDGNLTAIDFSGAKPRLIAQIKTEKGARTAALDPKTGDVLLPTADMLPPAPGSRRPTSAPGSFRILIVGHGS